MDGSVSRYELTRHLAKAEAGGVGRVGVTPREPELRFVWSQLPNGVNTAGGNFATAAEIKKGKNKKKRIIFQDV